MAAAEQNPAYRAATAGAPSYRKGPEPYGPHGTRRQREGNRGRSSVSQKRVVIMGAAGRDFHNFNMKSTEMTPMCRWSPSPRHRYRTSTGGDIPQNGRALLPQGIPIIPESNLDTVIRKQSVDEVVFAYSDVAHEFVMHQASRVLAWGRSSRFSAQQHRYTLRGTGHLGTCHTQRAARARHRASSPVF